MKLEEEKKVKYNSDIFQNRNYKQMDKVTDDVNINEVAMVEYKESIIRKILNRIKRLFYKK